jgi:hypothetical protein
VSDDAIADEEGRVQLLRQARHLGGYRLDVRALQEGGGDDLVDAAGLGRGAGGGVESGVEGSGRGGSLPE